MSHYPIINNTIESDCPMANHANVSSRSRPVSRPEAGQNVLGQFLRAKRDQLRPEDVGLRPGQRRRAPGLRREEVSALCAISPTWYTWIEQGRTRSVSVQTLESIAVGLRLSSAERAYLFDLAQRADPGAPRPAGVPAPVLTRLVRDIRSPAYILDRHWDAIAWNKAAAELFQEWLRAGAQKASKERREVPNLLRYVFLHPRSAAFIVDWPERARRLVAEFRADTASLRGEAAHIALVDDLRRKCPAFDTAWRSQRVLAREGGKRAFNHARFGRCEYEQMTLRVAQYPDLKVIVLIPDCEVV